MLFMHGAEVSKHSSRASYATHYIILWEDEQMKKTDKMSRAVSQLEHMYNSLNEDFYNFELPIPVITIQSSPGSYGHMTVGKVWKRKEDDAFELNIAAEVLNFPIEETIDTILHEMVHIYCRLHKIQKTSRGGYYHNKKFKEIAESHGCLCVMTKSGYNTKPGDNLIEYALQKGWSEISISRKTKIKLVTNTQGPQEQQHQEVGGSKSNSRKIQCPSCKNSVRATKKVNIICGDCLVAMQEVTK